MANYRKSFNFRNGVQVDTDNFIVNSLGSVGLGTTVPTELLDVYGNIRSTGIVTTSDLFVGSTATITTATITSVTVGSAVTITSSGIDVGAGVITATSFVGDVTGTITTATTAQGLTGTPDITVGILTATSAVVGSGVTINASGILAAAGVVTATSFVGDVTGNADTATTATNAQGLTGTPNITIGIVTATSAVVGSAVTINASGINVSGAVTATSYYGDGSTLTGIGTTTAGIQLQDSGSVVGTAITVNFGTNLSVTPISAGIVTVNYSGISSVFEDPNPQLGGNLNLSGSNINGQGAINITNTVTANIGFSTNGNDFLTFSGNNIEIIVSAASSTITFNAVGIGSTSFTLA